MANVIAELFDTTGFPARWHCGIWSDALGWLHIGSDVAIFGAYIAIPVVLAYFVVRKPDIPFPKIFWLFVAFIFSCGLGHLLEAIIFWHPVYRLAGVVKLVTAIVSWGTVVALVFVVPLALKFPGLAKLNADLALSNAELQLLMDRVQDRTASLEAEVAERLRAESQLAEHTRELEQFNRLAVDRELRMVELKHEINEMTATIGLPKRYDVEQLADEAREPIARHGDSSQTP
jgi:branched-subunit amino acid ABC-type transport system permease component